jgi:hypothetical protein
VQWDFMDDVINEKLLALFNSNMCCYYLHRIKNTHHIAKHFCFVEQYGNPVDAVTVTTTTVEYSIDCFFVIFLLSFFVFLLDF